MGLRLPAKMEAHVDTLCLLTKSKEDKNKFKNKNNQNYQKIELYGSLTTKELKKKHSSRPVGGVVQAVRVERTHSKAAAEGPGKVRQ